MKKLFTAIRQGKLDEVALILDKKPELISCLAKTPPKKDDGQSPLMVAIKSDNWEVAHLLLDRGADVNFQDAPTQPHNESVPIWYNAVGQCFMQAGHTVGPGPERSKNYFLLLRRLLEMGMDPNQRATSDYGSRNAWQYAIEQYDYFANTSLSDYPPSRERELEENRRLGAMLKAVLDELLKHGADIHAFDPPRDNGLPTTACLLRNLEENRELFDDFYGLNPAELKPTTITYRGRKWLSPPTPVEEQQQRHEINWPSLEPLLRAYYEEAR